MALLKKLDPQNADKWFSKIVPCESSYNPNLVNKTFWGLFQMDPSNPPGQAPPAPSATGNGPLQRGDVNWQLQAKMAVDYLKQHEGGDMSKNWKTCSGK